MTEIQTKVSIPPRRRTATLEVDLTDGRRIKASVNKGDVKITLKARTRYGTQDAVCIPRDPADIDIFQSLLVAVKREILEQDAFLEGETAVAR